MGLLHRSGPTWARSGLGSCVDGAPASSAELAWRRLRSGADCLACWCSHSSRLLALMWFARWVLIIGMGSTPVTQRRFSRLDARPINIMPSAPPQPVTLTACSSRSGVAIVRRPLRRSPHRQGLLWRRHRHSRDVREARRSVHWCPPLAPYRGSWPEFWGTGARPAAFYIGEELSERLVEIVGASDLQKLKLHGRPRLSGPDTCRRKSRGPNCARPRNRADHP
jgi:hypothetical protein